MSTSLRLKVGPLELESTTNNFRIVSIIVLAIILVIFLSLFPKYQSSIYGNQTISVGMMHLFAFSPIAILVLPIIVLILLILFKN